MFYKIFRIIYEIQKCISIEKVIFIVLLLHPSLFQTINIQIDSLKEKRKVRMINI